MAQGSGFQSTADGKGHVANFVWDTGILDWVVQTASGIGPATDVNVTNPSLAVTQSGIWTVGVNNFPAVQPVNDNGGSLTVDGPFLTDAELRARYKERSSAGGSTVSAIRDRVLQVPNIGVVFVFENYANFEVDGRPPHSIEVVVSGSATDEDIATAIYESKAGGIEPVGTESYSVTDENGSPQEMRWSLASEILVNVKVFIATNSDWVFTNEEVIRKLIIQYVGGVYTEGLIATNYPGLGVGKDVLAWGIESKFDGIVGIEDIEVFVALSPTVPSTLRKVSIIDTNYARVDNSNVTFDIT